MKLPFKNRREAGRALAAELMEYRGREGLLVLALPRGGVPVADEVAKTLGAPLDILVVRKLGVPGHRELAMGAIASNGVCVMHEDIVRRLGISETDISAIESEERIELDRRERTYRGERPRPILENRFVMLVDDGLATGATMEAAIQAVLKQQPEHLLVAVPVAPPDTVFRLGREVDKLVCLAQPAAFNAVGAWYLEFDAVSDAEVRMILDNAKRLQGAERDAGR